MLSKVDFTYPQKIAFKCNRCGLCCGDTEEKTRHILLLESEANVISAKTSLPKQEFTVQVADKAPYYYEMKKPKEGKCFFLKDNQCSIYQQRPLICRFYPFELKFSEDKETHVFDVTVECPGISKGKPMNRADFKELFLLAQERLG
jgi:Fe-S-cluster containining protein